MASFSALSETGGFVSISSGWLRLGVFVGVAVLVSVNALAPFGDDAARWFALSLQAMVGIGALICAASGMRRTTGVSRTWRALVAAAVTSWLLGETVWWLSGSGPFLGAAPLPSVVAYFGAPILALAALILLARSAGGLSRRGGGSPRNSPVLAVLDGFVAASAFSILVFLAGLGRPTTVAMPRSPNASVATASSVVELVVVVLAVLMATAYRRDRPHRRNYLLLSGGVVLLAGSDRLVAYLWSIGLATGDLWGGVGNTLGPLMIAFAMLELTPKGLTGASEEVMDWAQLVWPYIGFQSIVLLAPSTCSWDCPFP